MEPSMNLNTLAGCKAFVATQPPSVIAAQLRADHDLCLHPSSDSDRRLPSLLVHALPRPSSNAARAIYTAYFSTPPLLASVFLRPRYQAVLAVIRARLAESDRTTPSLLPEHLVPTTDEFEAALKVLNYLCLPPLGVDADAPTTVTEVMNRISAQEGLSPELRAELRTLDIRQKFAEDSPKTSNRRCYVCRYRLLQSHALYPSLCVPCGAFNVSNNVISLPVNLDLSGRTALVTGGRTNLGFATAVRLLRCGARVLVTSRYPHDAARRFWKQGWKDGGRLGVVGADFRRPVDVFGVVAAVQVWVGGGLGGRLDLLINNAAQTWTDKIDWEAKAIEREERLGIEDGPTGVCGLVVRGEYVPCVRGQLLEGGDDETVAGISALSLKTREEETAIKSTWTQTLREIPYSDFASTYAVNALAPLILTRELLPLLSRPEPSHSPPAYIINVTSREGLPESKPKNIRAGYHVHTNMAKAALHMLTATEAAVLWQKHRVAVNSVDPGFLSADRDWQELWGYREDCVEEKGETECETTEKTGEWDEERERGTWRGRCPITWEDGVGRVLWPIAVAEVGTTTDEDGSGKRWKQKGARWKKVVWGRFLRHYVEVQGVR